MKNVTIKQKTAAVLSMILWGISTTLNATGTSSAQFLTLGAGARAASMGDAFCSVAEGANATYWNPAGLVGLKSAELSFMQNNHLQETQYQYFGGAMPFHGENGLGMFVQRLDFGSIDRYTAADAKEGSFDAGSLAAGLSMGLMMKENLSLGFTAKFIQESIEAESATGFAGDVGLLYKHGRYNIGAAIQHLGTGLKMVQESASLPTTIRAGVSTKFLKEKMLSSVELSKQNDNEATVHAGIEYNISEMISFRGGYKLTPGNSLDVGGITNISGGFGLKLNRFNFDYSVSPFGDLGMAHRLSLGFRFAQN